MSDALGALGRRFTSETGVRVHAHVGTGWDLPLRLESELFRIAQEALANVRRHAKAKEVEITLRRRGRRVYLSIRDDGRGFAVRSRRSGRVGIVGMRERARLLGGTLRVESRPGRGTHVLASVPLPEGGA